MEKTEKETKILKEVNSFKNDIDKNLTIMKKDFEIGETLNTDILDVNVEPVKDLKESAAMMKIYLKGILKKELKVGQRIDKNVLELWKELNNTLTSLKPKQIEVKTESINLHDIHMIMKEDK